MDRQAKISIRKELESILNSHVDNHINAIQDISLSDLLDDIMAEIDKLDYIDKEQLEAYRDRWNNRFQKQEELYRSNTDKKDEELEASYIKINQLKESLTTDSTKVLLETKLAEAKRHNKILKEFVRTILEGM